MTQAGKIKFSTLIAGTLILSATVAFAGAPGLDTGAIVVDLHPSTEIQQLSPAEIRNAMSIKMDEQAARGIEVDRASVEGIGLPGYEQYRSVVEVKAD